MNRLLVRFTILLDSNRHHGPALHRWLPDGEQDSISLQTCDPRTTLKIWFNRFGYTSDGMIEFSLEKREVDAGIISRQGMLQSGPLFGQLAIESSVLTKEEIQSVYENEVGEGRSVEFASEQYERVGELVVKLIQSPVTVFLETLRCQYGQHWIPSNFQWNPNRESLGAFCRRLGMKWSLTDGVTWNDFTPNKSIVYLQGMVAPNDWFTQLLTYDDWFSLPSVLHKPTAFSAKILAEARREYEVENNRSYAFILATSGLELAVEEFVLHKKRARDDKWFKQINELSRVSFGKPFGDLGLAKKTRVIGRVNSEISDWVESCLEGVIIRNEIVHKGRVLLEGDDTDRRFDAIIRVAGKLINNPVLRFPHYTGLNKVLSNESDWQQ